MELQRAGVEPLSLAPFLFTPQDRALLAGECLGGSTLERRPLVRELDQVTLVLPTAVSAAIRYHIIERMEEAGMLQALSGSIANEYARYFADLHVLGGRRGSEISFQFTRHGAVAGVTTIIDKGRYLNLIFFTDSLTDLPKTGLSGLSPDGIALGDTVKKVIEDARNAVGARAGFVDGVSLIVACGVGRGASVSFNREDYADWRVEFTSAYDLETLSWTPRFKPLTLWRLLDAGKQVEALGVGLHNINGLLNLVAWTRSLDGHLVPHGDLPDDFVESGRGGFLMMSQNSLRSLRHEVATYYDAQMVQDTEGNWIPVRRDRDSEFADNAIPLYGSEVPNSEDWLMSAYLGARRAWWSEASIPQNTPGALAYERWRLVAVWLSRAAPVLDPLQGLPSGPVKWRAVFEAATGGLRGLTPQRSYEEVRAAITVAIDSVTSTVTTSADSVFEDAIYHPENIAERALVDAMLEGFLALAQASQENRPDLLREIVRSPQARHAHGFAARGFRDFLHQQLSHGLVRIDRDDDAAARLGLGWSVRDRALGGDISGKADTVAYLNSLVSSIEDELCDELRGFNRQVLLMRLLVNHEAAAFDRDRWSRTAAAVLGLHSDTESTLATIGNHEMELSAVFQTSRIVMEMAICESAVDGGREPGELDLSRLMAKAALLFHMGGWSDAIRWDVMEPTIKVTALGDVHAKFGYVDDVIAPHVREARDLRVKDAADNYAENLKQVEGTVLVSGGVDTQFLDAWEEEFGTTFQDMRIFIDWLENRGITLDRAVMHMASADFEDVSAEGHTLSADVVSRLLDKMTLTDRPRWREVPEGFDDRDRQPWRFRRRLSVVRRPILKIVTENGDGFLVAPGMVRDSFAYVVGNYMRGDFPPHQLGRKMRAWAARQADSRGAKFTRDVAACLEALGWQTETEVKITKILGRRLDRNYGDVDVLAWRPDGQRVLIIECKDVQFKKTYGEICEQLGDFRGELRPDGKPDYLRRHLDRMDLLGQCVGEVASYLNRANFIPILESHLVFKNPVPMKYALRKMSERVTVSLFDEIADWASQ